mgnify:FL=1
MQDIETYTNTEQVNQDYLGHKCPGADVTLDQDSCGQFILLNKSKRTSSFALGIS